MIKHVVLFQIDRHLPEAERQEAMRAFKAAIEALPEKISFLKSAVVGINVNPAEQWDLCLSSTLESMDDVKAYAAHPDHMAATALIKHCKVGRACVDYELPD